MATERRDIALSIIADTRRYQEMIAKIPGFTDAAAARAAQAAVKRKIQEENEKAKIQRKALDQALREDAKAERKRVQLAERANREIEGSYRDQFTSIRGLSGAAFGGMAGDVFDLVEVVSGAGKGLAAVGAALAALAIAPEVVRGIKEYADGAAETAEALGRTFTDEQRRKVNAYEVASASLASEFNSLKLESQILTAEALTPLVQALAQTFSGINNILDSRIVAYFGDLYDAVGESKDQFREMLGPIDDVVMAIMRLPQTQLQFLMSFGDAQADFSPMAASILKATEGVDDLAESGKKLGKVYHDEGKSVEEVFSRTASGVDELAKMEAEALADIEAGRNEEARQDRQRYQARIDSSREAADAAIQELNREMEAEREHDLFLAESHARAMERAKEEDEKRKEQREELEQTMLSLADLQATAVGAVAAFSGLKFEALREGATDATNKADALRGEIESLRSTMEGANESERREIQATINAKEAELRTAENEAKNARKLARKAFKETQALRIAETIISGAAAGVRALAELGPVAGAIAAASIAVTTGVQVATIKAQKPPKFHDGGMIQPDESLAVLRRGEAVLNERAAQRLGRQAIESLNRDEPLGAVNIYLGEDLLRSQRLTRSARSGAHSAIGARSPYVGR